MPLYEYECRNCKVHTDVRHGFDEKNAESCPACGGELARVFSASGIVFKGSGFYINDSRKPSTEPGGSSTSSGGSATSGGATSSGATPPAASTPDAPSAPSTPAAPSGGDSKSGSGVTTA